MTAVTQHDLSRRERHEPPVQSDVAPLIEALAREGITAPADATHAMALLHECSERYTSPDLRTWITGADLATLDAARIMTELDSAWVRASMLRQGSGLLHDVLDVLDVLDARAVEAVAADVHRLIGDLRPAWDVAANVVAAAAATGISSASTAADVIKLGDDAVAAWRTLPPAIATLNRLHRVRNRLLFLAGRELSEGDIGEQRWLDRAYAGPPALTATEITWQRRRVQLMAARALPAPPSETTPTEDVEQTTDEHQELPA